MLRKKFCIFVSFIILFTSVFSFEIYAKDFIINDDIHTVVTNEVRKYSSAANPESWKYSQMTVAGNDLKTLTVPNTSDRNFESVVYKISLDTYVPAHTSIGFTPVISGTSRKTATNGDAPLFIGLSKSDAFYLNGTANAEHYYSVNYATAHNNKDLSYSHKLDTKTYTNDKDSVEVFSEDYYLCFYVTNATRYIHQLITKDVSVKADIIRIDSAAEKASTTVSNIVMGWQKNSNMSSSTWSFANGTEEIGRDIVSCNYPSTGTNYNGKAASWQFTYSTVVPPHSSVKMQPHISGAATKVGAKSGGGAVLYIGISDKSEYTIQNNNNNTFNHIWTTTQGSQFSCSASPPAVEYTNDTDESITKTAVYYMIFTADYATAVANQLQIRNVSATYTLSEFHKNNHDLDTRDLNSNNDKLTFSKWEEADSLPTENGSYYLTSDVTLTEPYNVAGSKTINLCLAGHRIKYGGEGEGSAVNIEQEGTLNLTDCDQETVHSFEPMGEVWTENASGHDIVYGGTIEGGSESVILNKGTLNMYGGTVIGNTKGIDNEGTLNISGGSIIGNATGIYDNGTLKLSSTPFISGNSREDIYFCKAKVAKLDNFTPVVPLTVGTEEKPDLKNMIPVTDTSGTGQKDSFTYTGFDYMLTEADGVIKLDINMEFGKEGSVYSSYVAENAETKNTETAEQFKSSHVTDAGKNITQNNTGDENGNTVSTAFEAVLDSEGMPEGAKYLAWFINIPVEGTYVRSSDENSGFDSISIDSAVISDSESVLPDNNGSLYSIKSNDDSYSFMLKYKYKTDEAVPCEEDGKYVFSLIADDIYAPSESLVQLKLCTEEEYNSLSKYGYKELE